MDAIKELHDGVGEFRTRAQELLGLARRLGRALDGDTEPRRALRRAEHCLADACWDLEGAEINLGRAAVPAEPREQSP